MQSALINLGTGLVENVIVADPSVDPVPDDHALVGAPPPWVKIGTPWDGTKFVADGVTAPKQISGVETL